jgi:hypothetical protein
MRRQHEQEQQREETLAQQKARAESQAAEQKRKQEEYAKEEQRKAAIRDRMKESSAIPVTYNPVKNRSAMAKAEAEEAQKRQADEEQARLAQAALESKAQAKVETKVKANKKASKFLRYVLRRLGWG